MEAFAAYHFPDHPITSCETSVILINLTYKGILHKYIKEHRSIFRKYVKCIAFYENDVTIYSRALIYAMR